MGKRKTITLTDKQDSWIKAQIDAGHYTNVSEYIRDLIRREQERSVEIEAIRAALIEGESSGEPRPFDTGTFKQRMLGMHGGVSPYPCRSMTFRRPGPIHSGTGTLERAVRPEGRVKLGSFLAYIAREAGGLTDEEHALFESARIKAPAHAAGVE